MRSALLIRLDNNEHQQLKNLAHKNNCTVNEIMSCLIKGLNDGTIALRVQQRFAIIGQPTVEVRSKRKH